MIFIVLVIAVAGGFLLWKKYGSSNEKADLEQYYDIGADDEIAVVINNEVIRENEDGSSDDMEAAPVPGRIYDGQYYLEYSVVRDRINERTSSHILSFGIHCREADDYLRGEALSYLREEAQLSPGEIRLDKRGLKEKPQIFRRYVIIEGLRLIGASLKDLSEVHFETIDRALSAGKGHHADKGALKHKKPHPSIAPCTAFGNIEDRKDR